jgi:chromosome partitioning protein
MATESGMRVLALASQKGGAGKTTLAVHLAVALGGPTRTQDGRRVVLVDTDPQGSAAAWGRSREAETPELVEAEASAITATLRSLRAQQGAALAIIDTEPSVHSDIGSIARAADLVLIPTRPAILDLRAVGRTVDVVKKDARVPAAIVLNGCPPRIGAGEAAQVTEARRALKSYGLPVLEVAIGHRAVLAHALAAGLAVAEFEPQSKAAAEIAALARFVESKLWQSVPTSQSQRAI